MPKSKEAVFDKPDFSDYFIPGDRRYRSNKPQSRGRDTLRVVDDHIRLTKFVQGLFKVLTPDAYHTPRLSEGLTHALVGELQVKLEESMSTVLNSFHATPKGR